MSATAEGPTGSGRRAWGRLIPLACLVLLPLAAALFGWWRSRPEPEALPTFSLDGLDPLVRHSIEKRQQEIEADPHSGAAWGGLGMIFGGYAMRPQAIVAFANAELFEPNEPRWPYFRAVALMQDGAEAEAIAPARRAVALGTGDPDAPRLRLAEFLLRRGDLAEAETHFDALLAQNPKHAPALLGLARIALSRDRLREAEALAGRCLGSPFVRQAAYRLLAEVRQQRGDQPGAEAARRLAEKLPADTPWPDPYLDEIEQVKIDRRTRVARAVAARAKNRLEEYRRLLEELDRDYPGTKEQLEGRRLLEAKDFGGAERTFRRAIGRDPEFAQAHFWLGVCLLEQGNARGAVGAFREVLRLQPTHAAAFDYLGRCLESVGDRAGAIDAFRSAIRYRPQNPEAHFRLGSLLEERGRDAEALGHLQRALSLRPDFPAAREKADRVRKRLPPPPR